MATEVKLKILGVKSLTYFIAKEMDTNGAKEFEGLEQMLQKTYSGLDITHMKEEMDIGSYVCVKTNIGPPRRSPKIWARAVVRNVFMSVGTYLYEVHLLDYGLDRVVKRTEVRELKPQFSDEFTTSYQAINFHLVDIELKDDVVNSIDGKEFVEDLFKRNDNLVRAKIRRNTRKNRLGHIILSDGSDLRQHFIDKGWANPSNDQTDETTATITDEFIPNTTVRKPKTSPIFKSSNSSVKMNRSQDGSFSDKNSVTSDSSSISSVSSVDVSINSDTNPLTTDEEDFTMNFIAHSNKPKKIAKEDLSSNEMNGIKNGTNGTNDLPKSRREKLSLLMSRIKLINQDQSEEIADNINAKINFLSNEQNQSVSDIQYVSYLEPKTKDDVDWPVVDTHYSRPKHQYRPAGLQPPPEVLERIFTLKAQKKAAAVESEMW